MRNRMYGGVRGRKTKVGEKLHRFPPTRFSHLSPLTPRLSPQQICVYQKKVVPLQRNQ